MTIAEFNEKFFAAMREHGLELIRPKSSNEAMNQDVWDMLRALGLPDHVRPSKSCHDVVRGEILPAIEAMRRVVIQARALTEDQNACWEDLIAALDDLGGVS